MAVEHYEDVSDKTDKVEFNNTKSVDSFDPELNDLLAKFVAISDESKENDRKDKTMPLMEGLRTFPKAAFWSFVLCSTLIMEGYDTNLLNSFYNFPGFNKKFGKYYPEIGEYQIPTKWQTSLSMAVNCGEFLGLFIAGFLGDRYGYRYTLLLSLFLVTCFIFIVFFAKNIEMLLVGEILLGLPWGAFQTLCVTYASDVCPLSLRLYLTTYANCCWVIGQLISSCVLKAQLSKTSPDSYKLPFALQWMWPLPIAIGVFMAPESPYWLLRKGKYEEAKVSVDRLLTQTPQIHDKQALVNATVNKMDMTLKEEAANDDGSTFQACFQGPNLRRTLLACMVWLIQNCTGSALMGYSTYFYTQAGLATSMSFTFSIIQYCLGLIGILASWTISAKFGRFDIYFYGLCILFLLLIGVGCTGIAKTKAAGWATGSLLLVYTFVYDSTIGPICYCLVTELPSVRLRNKTVILARNAYNVSGIVIAVVTPYMLNPTAWNWKAKTGFFWSGFALASLIGCWFYLPETKGRTFAELDNLFELSIGARQFKHTEADVFNTDRLIAKLGEDGVKEYVDDVEHLRKETV